MKRTVISMIAVVTPNVGILSPTDILAIAARLLAESTDEQPGLIATVNLLYVSSLTDVSACSQYRSNESVRYAKGMTHLFDEIPLKQARTIRLRVRYCFSCESYCTLFPLYQK